MHSFTFPAVLLVTVAIYKIVSNFISGYLWNKHSILKDIHLLSKARPQNEKLPGTAIICGGSVGGLFAARVCANHFKEVLIIEPEQWVIGEEGLEDHHRDANSPKRSRVAHYTAFHHFHLFMTSAMKEMFPMLEQAIEHVGGRLAFYRDIFWIFGFPVAVQPRFPYYWGGVYPRIINLTRPAFETTLRRLVLQTCKEVQYFHGTVNGLLYDETANRVSGVDVKLPNGETTEIKGNLVVDATGSFLGGFRWLKAISKLSNSNMQPLQDIKISYDHKMNYTTCEFALPPKVEEDFRKYKFPSGPDPESMIYVSVPTDGNNNRHLIINKREKNFLHLVCGGYNWHGRIESIGDIEEFLKDLDPKQPFPDWLNDMVNTLQSADVPVSFVHSKCPPSVYIKYHELDYLPSNFIVVGDALSQTNPVTGHGCAKACAQSIILNSQLNQCTPDFAGFLPETFAKRYFLEVKDRTEHIWTNLKNTDYNFPTTAPVPGENLKTTARFLRAYGDILLLLAVKDADISGVLYRQAAWLDPPTDIMAPWLIRRAAWAWIKQLFGYRIL